MRRKRVNCPQSEASLWAKWKVELFFSLALVHTQFQGDKALHGLNLEHPIHHLAQCHGVLKVRVDCDRSLEKGQTIGLKDVYMERLLHKSHNSHRTHHN